MRKCPFCAEEIQDEAIKCRFCNEILVGNPFLVKQEKEAEKKVPWYCRGWSLFIIYLIAPPISSLFCLPLVWIHPRWSRNTKIMISIIIAGSAWLLWVMLTAAVQSLKTYYGPIIQMVAPELKI